MEIPGNRALAKMNVQEMGVAERGIVNLVLDPAPRKMHQQACKSQILMCSLRVTRSSALTGSSTTFTANTRARLPGINDLV